MENKKSTTDYLSLAITTFGVGYLPLAPGTWGSMVAVVIYLVFRYIDFTATANLTHAGFDTLAVTAWFRLGLLVLFIAFCLVGIWAVDHALKFFTKKDPSEAVVDEVMGQLLTFMFIPFTTRPLFVISGFLLFRLFDIWKPYPVDSLQDLPGGLGVCADDLIAGVYAGVVLAFIYALTISF